MLPTIVQHSQDLIAFITALNLSLYSAQMQHLLQIVDALLTSSEKKTISGLYRLFKSQPDPKSGADFFRESPWIPKDIALARKRWMVTKFLELASQLQIPFVIFASIDDSLGKKGQATKHLEAVDYQHNHTESTRKKQAYTNGYIFVELHLQIGPFGFLFDAQPYLRERKVRHLNRKRKEGKRLHFRTKYTIAQHMLTELDALLPKGHKVYVLFDSWYASKKLIKFCRRKRWHVICALKSNRRIDKVNVTKHNQQLRHKPYKRITLEAMNENRKAPKYYTRSIRGHLTEIFDPVHVIISKKGPRDKYPKYFACTDLSLSVQQVLRYYQKRWAVEVDNTYLKNALGLGDFRLQSFEAIEKWFAVVVLAINYLQYRMALAYSIVPSKVPLADFIRLHRLEHFKNLLRSVLEPFAKPHQIEACLKEVFTASPQSII